VLVALLSLNIIRIAISAENDQQNPEYRQPFQHDSAIVPV
jgi:hypothetical protein